MNILVNSYTITKQTISLNRNISEYTMKFRIKINSVDWY